MEFPSNQYDVLPRGTLDTAMVLSSWPISICRAMTYGPIISLKVRPEACSTITLQLQLCQS